MNPTVITAQPGTPYIDVVREFDAPPELVFRAHTDPELAARWLGPRGMQMEVLEHDARTGGGYRHVHRSREGEFRFRGVFHTVVPDKLIVQLVEVRAVSAGRRAIGHATLSTNSAPPIRVGVTGTMVQGTVIHNNSCCIGKASVPFNERGAD